MVAQSVVSSPAGRLATLARWAAALERADANGVTVYRIAGTGEFVATSQREPGTVYRTDGTTCECAAAVLGNDPVCAHRAAVRRALGWLSLPILVASPVVESTAVRCRSCHRGTQTCRDGSEVRCVQCGGSGWLPRCPHCHGDEAVEVWNDFAGDYETVACSCVTADAEPVALAAD